MNWKSTQRTQFQFAGSNFAAENAQKAAYAGLAQVRAATRMIPGTFAQARCVQAGIRQHPHSCV